ncbi:MAG: ATP-binding protein [Mycoplasmataceae bacterium]|nr:ATP-binding protein [Mycoplasmataceae bacterium]
MIKRKAHDLIKLTIKEKQIPIVIGLRRIGKTTILNQLNEELEDSFYISFDDFELSLLTDSAFWSYLQNMASKYKYLLLDEVQTRNNWDLMIKNLYDQFVTKGLCDFVVTGSSSMNLFGREMGSNRTKRIYLDTWDFDEYIKLTGLEKNFENFENFIGRGFPDYMNSNKTIHEKLNELLKPIIVNDIPKAFPQTNTLSLLRFVNALANLTNGEVNETRLSIDTGIARKTVSKYIDILEKATLLKIVHKIDSRLISPKNKKIKIYLNPHFHVWILGKEFKDINPKIKGHIIESYWLHWTKSLLGWSEEFYYLKDNSTNQEIDFVSLTSDNKAKTLYEFKYSNNPNSNSLFVSTPANNKIIWCKETKEKNGIKYISILDLNNK